MPYFLARLLKKVSVGIFIATREVHAMPHQMNKLRKLRLGLCVASARLWTRNWSRAFFGGFKLKDDPAPVAR
jgi:hypothetical protein